MRSTITVRSITIISFIILSSFINLILLSNNTTATDEELLIDAPDKVIEGTYFSVSVLNNTSYLVDVSIFFNNLEYEIFDLDEDGEVSILAPLVTKNTTYDIIASKEGYATKIKTITILDSVPVEDKVQLIIKPDHYTVDAGEKFSVLITDKDNNEIYGVIVAIQSYGNSTSTDDGGRAWLTAPQNMESFTIIAEKDGYLSDSETIQVNIPKNFWENQYFPIVLAAIILVIVILYVNHRQRKSVYNRASELSNEKVINKYNKTEENSNEKKNAPYGLESVNENIKIQQSNEAKVEEIRITRPRKEKEVIPVKTEDDKEEKQIDEENKDYEDEWFKGKDELKYEIDKLTGEVDENGVDKWFEGVDELKEKVNEKVKKKDKKQEEEKQ